MSKKTYTIEKYHRGRTSTQSGTLEELINYFGYTLECGHSWNRSIPREPKTFKSLVSALNRSVRETQGSCYDPDYYREVAA